MKALIAVLQLLNIYWRLKKVAYTNYLEYYKQELLEQYHNYLPKNLDLSQTVD